MTQVKPTNNQTNKQTSKQAHEQQSKYYALNNLLNFDEL